MSTNPIPNEVIANALVAESLLSASQKRPLSGPEIRDARIEGGRSTFPTRRRFRMWERKGGKGSHIGKKQALKRARRDGA